jgi:hypothetical protein
MTKFISLIFLVLFTTKICCSQYNENFGSTEECYGKTFSIAAWVLTDTTNSIAPLDLSQVLVAIDSLNQKFKSICVDFKLCSFDTLSNHRQDTIEKGLHDEEIAAMYRKKNVINLYFATEIINPSPGANPAGYAPLGSTTIPDDDNQRDAIFLKKSEFSPSVLLHEIGHYFGLYHTFESVANGEEFADGSNCATAGCHLDPQVKDPQTNLMFEPPVCNIMSYYNNQPCNYHFSRGQLDRMLSIMKTGRSYLW